MLIRRPSRHSRAGTSGGCCGCLCWCCCFFLLFAAAAAATGAYLVHVLRPKAPSYSVSDMSVAQFDASAVYTKLVASVRAENPTT
ncbi:hypothetical protein PR202_ga20702 [Eleusine coracana subsp. coracana]|uniref:Uncharacterized protein n=1 Tax=Eleusine coracana subsp. coracana TaxID=191504 RepID=A0AAV5CYY8_ELECO|nr:hypothetical protein PR202_ga20702 [Eleusine coracana subsp. coracana]